MDAILTRPESTTTQLLTETINGPQDLPPQPVLRLRLNKPKPDLKVGWKEGTVDNENMDKKKSKCCCIYKKPHKFGESSSEEEEECEHCFGHPEKRRNRKGDNKSHDCGHCGGDNADADRCDESANEN